jgi:ribosomal protein S18 acetylase RimI-like enzyme
MVNVRPYAKGDDVLRVWRECHLIVSQNDPVEDIRRKLRVNPEWFLVAEIGREIVATCMVGYEGHRGWINYLGVLPDFQRKGIATALMREAERVLSEAGCPKINLQVRATNPSAIEFYKSLGFSVDEVTSMGKRLGGKQPSPDETPR